MENEEKTLIDGMYSLQQAQRDIERKIKDLKQRIVNLSLQKNKKILNGTYKNCLINEYTKIIYPENKDNLVRTIRELGLYDNLSMLNYSRISSRINKNEIPQEILNHISKEKDFRVVLVDIV